MIVIRNTADIEKHDLQSTLPYEVYMEIERLSHQLDELYGEKRGEKSDGGIIVIAEKKSDLKTIKAEYASLNECDCEGEDIIATAGCNYVNQLYLSNNEFGVNVIIPERFLGGSAQS
ncbi:hypothetical protein [Pyramidobacter sp.]|uniref:hypothetical protein n=1 Tax=Pyramidobacter sp. TaxID=1943581 RepID=UPI00332C038E